MKYIIEDYNISKHQEVDTWVNEKKYENAKIINEFALFNEPISDFYNHICTYPHDLANVKSFIKVFKNTNNILGVVVFHYYVDEVYYLRINPLIVNPSLMKQGIGKNILKEITKNLKEIINDKVDYIVANIDETNYISVKLFENIGFKRQEVRDNFIEFVYKV